MQRPSIWIIDLKTDRIISRYEIPESIVPHGKGLASITVDDDECANSFAYLPDWLNNALIVFSAARNRSWRFNHNFFFFNPFEGDYDVDGREDFYRYIAMLIMSCFSGVQFQWNDGIFSVALSGERFNGFRTAFFHPLSSNSEFTISTEVLRNESLAGRRTHGRDFKFVGQRGINSQAGPHYFDLNSNVIFFAEVQKNSVSCWNIKEPLNPSNVHMVEQDNSTLIYPVDLIVS